ncbi:hypothetical protein DTO164E3_3541 [Paecilomyces variotii]|nr:hypothetical protein DTO164E3_3541 [Paecilomyces variotii]KAJ9204766.1 hypothetical protein DTO032I3_2511 [Paecilomyces variotii]KAJ9223771.1 hypothetical protein DTO169C6_3885 [Paecilomyces variotii]KAJ9279868.1 hypothetical protein DTO021D3_3373 [Paecilomyces variotii]KAJ9338875.1 hypothetical protein DTO027B6_8579 [Paecilomyces variotii]
MTAPLAKGLIITVSVLVAAGIAAYENPQVRQWVSNSRRKIAVALHSLGDEIHPGDSRPEDISMTEEMGEAAEERRQRAREEIMRRGALLEARRRRKASSSSGTFDTLVDEHGNLKNDEDLGILDEPLARSTAIYMDLSEVSNRRGQSETRVNSEEQSQYQRDLLETAGRDRLRIAVPSEVSSNHPSEALVDLTPTSEFPEADAGWADHHAEQQPLTESEFFSAASRRSSTNHSVDMESGFYYARPELLHDADNAGIQSPFSDDQGHQRGISSASSIAGSLTHVHHDISDASSDGTLSDNGHLVDGISTPASWSEVGSVISGDDNHH